MYDVKKQFDELIEQYHVSLFRLIFGQCGNKEDAEDIVQIAYLRLWKSDMKFETIMHAKNWLYKVAVNQVKDMKRSKWAKVELCEQYDDIPFDNEEEINLFCELQRLKPEYRIVLLLYYYEDYSIAEISKMLNIKESTVATRLQRARNKLKLELEEEYGR